MAHPPIGTIRGAGIMAAALAMTAGPVVSAPIVIPPGFLQQKRSERYVFVRHQGKRQRLRALKQLTRGIVVPEALAPRLEAFVGKQPPTVDPEHLRLAVLNEARRLHESTGADFASVLDNVLTKFETEIQAQIDAVASQVEERS